MSKSVIIVEGLGKQYNIGTLYKRQQHDTLRDKIASGFKSVKKQLAHRKMTILGAEKFWALRDVSFEVKQGEVLGIIGKNGAGKSTLLKILCKVTSPTEGRATLKGKVGSLLEVGTGFHQELTGRENIYLSGAILGMDKAYIDNKHSEIIEFSGIEQFIDTPVKRYSSGMRVRLGFAVAAHLEPEILLIDEVLAVGDTEFQKKCLGKMGDVASEGRTILFVSHNMGAIAELCTRAILIRSGNIAEIGDPSMIIAKYLKDDTQSGRINLLAGEVNNIGEKKFKVSFLETRNEEGHLSSDFTYGETIVVRIGIISKWCTNAILGIGIRDSFGRQILHFNNKNDNEKIILQIDLTCIELRFKNILNYGEYYLTVWIGDELLVTQDYARNCLRFSVDTWTLGRSLVKSLVIQQGFWDTVDPV